MEKKKILVFSVSNYPDSGGIADHYNSHLKYLKKANMKVMAVDFFIKTNNENLNVFFRKRHYIRDFYLILKLIKEFSPDIIHVHDPRVTVATIIPIILNKRTVISSHGFIFHNGEPLYKRLYFRYALKVYKRAFKVIAVGKSDYLRIKSLSNAVLFENPIDDSKICPYLNNKEEGRFLIVSRNVPHKRIDVGVNYFLSIPMHQKHLTIVTDSYQIDNEQVTVLNNVTTDGLTNLMSKAEFLIHPSLYEGYGLVVYEAILNNCIPIVSPLSVYKNIVDEIFSTDFIDAVEDFSEESAIRRLPQFKKRIMWSENLEVLFNSIYEF